MRRHPSSPSVRMPQQPPSSPLRLPEQRSARPAVGETYGFGASAIGREGSTRKEKTDVLLTPAKLDPPQSMRRRYIDKCTHSHETASKNGELDFECMPDQGYGSGATQPRCSGVAAMRTLRRPSATVRDDDPVDSASDGDFENTVGELNPNAFGHGCSRSPGMLRGMASQQDSMDPSAQANFNHSRSQPQQAAHRMGIMRVTDVLPAEQAAVFRFEYFNPFQALCFDAITRTNENLVVSAPTAAGKTVLFELAIIRLFSASPSTFGQKVVYISPLRALCQEKAKDWTDRFSPLGLKVAELTGDTDEFAQRLRSSQIIVTTPEKLSGVTRRCSVGREILRKTSLLLIDEVHMLNLSNRGPVLEEVVARMRTVHKSVSVDEDRSLRVLAVSASIPNINDIGAWLGAPSHGVRVFGPEYRPVQLQKIVQGFGDCKSEFLFQQMLDGKLASVLAQHNPEGKPALVFCVTKSGCEKAARKLLEDPGWTRMAFLHKDELRTFAQRLSNNTLQSLVPQGVAVHHGDLDTADRNIIESLFIQEKIRVVFCTSTLAVGVNLPCHIVIVKSTLAYQAGEWREYDALEMLQMIGRAGRPQFDTSGKAVIMTEMRNVKKWQDTTLEKSVVNSHLGGRLSESLMTEVCAKTITDMPTAMFWLKATFLHARIRASPREYSSLVDKPQEENPLLREPADVDQAFYILCHQAFSSLQNIRLLSFVSDPVQGSSAHTCSATELGQSMVRYGVRLETMRRFVGAANLVGGLQVSSEAVLQQLMELLSEADEFADVKPRQGEKAQLRRWGKSLVRWRSNSVVDTAARKVNIILQLALTDEKLSDEGGKLKSWELKQQQTTLIQTAKSLMLCLQDVFRVSGNGRALAESITLGTCLNQRLWETSPLQCKQLQGVGEILATKLKDRGLSTFEALARADPRQIELAVGRKPPYGNQLQCKVRSFPRLSISLRPVPPGASASSSTPRRPCDEGNPDVALTTLVSVVPHSLMNASTRGGSAPPFHQPPQASTPGAEVGPCRCQLLAYAASDGRLLLATPFFDAATPGAVPGSATNGPLEVQHPSTGVIVRILCRDVVGLDSQEMFASSPLPATLPATLNQPKSSSADSGASKRKRSAKTCSNAAPVQQPADSDKREQSQVPTGNWDSLSWSESDAKTANAMAPPVRNATLEYARAKQMKASHPRLSTFADAAAFNRYATNGNQAHPSANPRHGLESSTRSEDQEPSLFPKLSQGLGGISTIPVTHHTESQSAGFGHRDLQSTLQQDLPHFPHVSHALHADQHGFTSTHHLESPQPPWRVAQSQHQNMQAPSVPIRCASPRNFVKSHQAPWQASHAEGQGPRTSFSQIPGGFQPDQAFAEFEANSCSLDESTALADFRAKVRNSQTNVLGAVGAVAHGVPQSVLTPQLSSPSGRSMDLDSPWMRATTPASEAALASAPSLGMTSPPGHSADFNDVSMHASLSAPTPGLDAPSGLSHDFNGPLTRPTETPPDVSPTSVQSPQLNEPSMRTRDRHVPGGSAVFSTFTSALGLSSSSDSVTAFKSSLMHATGPAMLSSAATPSGFNESILPAKSPASALFTENVQMACPAAIHEQTQIFGAGESSPWTSMSRKELSTSDCSVRPDMHTSISGTHHDVGNGQNGSAASLQHGSISERLAQGSGVFLQQFVEDNAVQSTTQAFWNSPLVNYSKSDWDDLLDSLGPTEDDMS